MEDPRKYNIGNSNYSKHKIQPYDIWEEYKLDPWRADIVKRILRTKSHQDTVLDLQKIIHVCQYLITKERNQRILLNSHKKELNIADKNTKG
jgi:hypothetical protein